MTPTSASIVRLDFGDSQAEEILLQTAAPGVVFQMVSSSGVEIDSGRVDTMGWFAIPLATASHNHVLLHLSVEGLPGDQTGLRVRVDRLRIPLSTLAAHTRAATLYSKAQTHHNSMRAEDVHQAITEYQQAAAAWRAANDTYSEAIALAGEAEAQSDLSQYSMAAQALVKAINLAANNEYLHAWLTHLAARVFLDEWESGEAKRYAEESLTLGKKTNESSLVAQAQADRAEAQYYIHDSSAVEDAKDALALALSSGLPETAAYILRTQAWIEKDQGHLSRALSLIQESETYFRKAGDLRRTLEATEDIAGIDSMTGDHYSALTRYFTLLPLSQNAGNVARHGILLQNIGNHYLDLNQLALADDYYRMAEREFSRVRFRSGLGLVHGKICDVELRFQDLESARRDCEIAVKIAKDLNDEMRIAIEQYLLGKVYLKSGNTQQARIDFELSAKASIDVKDKRWGAKEQISLGEVLDELGEGQNALDKFETALSQGVDAHDPTDVLDAQFYIARWYVSHDQFEKADEELKPVLEQIEASRRSVPDTALQASYFAAEHRVYELGVELCMRSGGDARALELSERSRARGLIDALRARAANGAGTRGGIQTDVLRSNMAVDKVFDQRLKLMLDGADQGKLETNAAKLRATISSLQRAEDAARPLQLTANALPPSITAVEIQNANWSSGDTYLEYELGEKRSYLWVIKQGGLRGYSDLPPRKDIEGMVRKWRTFVTSRGLPTGQPSPQEHSQANFQRLSLTLACALLPNSALLQSLTATEPEAKRPIVPRLIIVPDGDLAILPFGALPEVVHARDKCRPKPHGAPLAFDDEIVLAPSLSVFLSKKPQADDTQFKGEVAIVADPVFNLEDAKEEAFGSQGRRHQPAAMPSADTSVDLPRLTNTKSEADEIKAIFREQALKRVRFDASVQTVLDPAMQDYRIWHLATHGIYDQTTPQFSGLVFSRFASDLSPAYGFLKAQDIEHMNMRAQLVVLNACNTATGENVSGEGVMGLTYSFLRAGAKEVVSTLWSIDDEVTEDLMRKFYSALKSNGYDAAAALHESQRAVMREHRNRDPYYWAAFELVSVGN